MSTPIRDTFSPSSLLGEGQKNALSISLGTNSAQKSAKRSAAKLGGIRIIGTGIGAPGKLVKNEALAELGYDSDWIIQRTGIEERYHVKPGEATSDLAYRAARQALERANLGPKDIDLIIVATMSPDHTTPSTACILQHKLGSQAAAMDLNAACSGFMYGLVTAAQFVKTGCCRNALVVGAEVLSNVADPEDKKTFPLFGDGAGAAIIAADPEFDEQQPSGILAHRIAAVGEMWDKLYVPAGGSREPFSQEVLDTRSHYLKMDGRSVFKWAVRLIPEIVSELLRDAELEKNDLDLIVLHQANRRIIDAAAETLGMDSSKVFVNVNRYGNTSAASIPISLHEAVIHDRIQPGSNVLMAGFGAGLTWGGCIFRW